VPAQSSDDNNEAKSPNDGEYFTYTPSDPGSYARALNERMMKEVRAARQEKRESTRGKIAKIPWTRVKIAVSFLGVAILATCAVVWGMASAIALLVGFVSTSAFIAVNDVRQSVVQRDRSWRQRHRILSFMVPRHPLDHD
jgi:hypothetical protein